MRLAPKNGAAYAFLGLCEFGLKDYERSLQHLLQSRILGVGDTQDLGNIARYHAAILMTRIEQYEQALETLGEFAGGGNDNPRVIEAMGLATLRMAPAAGRGAAGSPRDGADGRPRQLHDGDAEHGGRREGVRDARLALSGNAERPLRVRRIPAPGATGQGSRGVQAGARAAAGASLVADADCLRVPEARRRAGRAAVGAAGRGRRTQRVPRAQGARAGAARDRRRGRRHQGSCRPASSSRRRARACTSTSRAPTSVPAGWKRPRASATSSPGWIGWRARCAPARSRSAEDEHL